LGTDAVEQVPGGDGDLLAGFVITRRGGLRRGRLHGADLAPGFVAATLRQERLYSQQTMLERLLLSEAGGRQQREHTICVGGSSGGKPRTRRTQTEFRGVAAGGFGCEALIQAGSGSVVSRADQFFGAIDAWWAATTGGGLTTGEHGSERNDDQQCKWSC
jgi:hypothetical protein